MNTINPKCVQLRMYTLEDCKESAKKYETMAAWMLACPRLYGTAFKNNWLDQCCTHMQNKPDKSDCIETALTCLSLPEWKLSYPLHYATAKSNEWLVDCCSHMTRIQLESRKNGDNLLKQCIAFAGQYKTRSDWKKGDESSYRAARNNGFMDECCAHMITSATKQECIDSAELYSTATEWELDHPRFYEKAQSNGWLNECFGQRPKKRITKADCFNSASLCLTRKEWRLSHPKCYRKAYSTGWLDEICARFNAK